MPQALPPSLAALLARDDFADAVFEGGRCAHSVGEASPIFELVLDRLLAALDGESTVSPSGGYGFPARAASYHQGLDFQLGRVNEKGGWDRFDPVQKSKFHGALRRWRGDAGSSGAPDALVGFHTGTDARRQRRHDDGYRRVAVRFVGVVRAEPVL